MGNERKIIGILGGDKYDPSNPDNPKHGFVRCLYEIFPDGEIAPINIKKMLCETEKVFVTKGYHSIRDKFMDSVFLCTCTKANYHKKGDSLYITNDEFVSHLKISQTVEIIKNNLPDVNDPVFNIAIKPSTKMIILDNGSHLFGPFEYDIQDADDNFMIELKTRSFCKGKIPPYFIAKTPKENVSHLIKVVESNESKITYLNTSDSLTFYNFEKVDYISDEQIVSNFSLNLLKKSDLSRVIKKNNLKLISAAASKMKDYLSNKKRYDRLSDILNKSTEWEANRIAIVNSFLENTSSGKNEIKKYIESKEDSYFKEYKNDVFNKIKEEEDSRNEKISRLKNEIKKLYDEKTKIDEDNKRKEVEKPDFSDIEKGLSKEIDILKIRKNSLESDLYSIKKEYEEYNRWKSLDETVKKLEEDEKFIERSIQRKEETEDRINKELRSKNNRLFHKMLELKPAVDALSGITSKTGEELCSFTKAYNIEKTNKRENQEEYIEGINNQLMKVGRALDYSELVNIIISIAQSQFILFSGQPGTGKTSLAKILSKAMGLGERFCNIPVSKGWTSPRDVFGFYNTLSQTFQSSPSGLYELLKRTQDESSDEYSLILVLLDEFNLSQPEHYFSSFLEMSDPESERIIKTGDPKLRALKVPNYMKFLGTINNDDSVQSLTPRMIDRCAIIHFSQPSDEDIWSSLSNRESIDNNIKPISAKGFIELFSPKSVSPDEHVASLLSKIAKELANDDPSLGNNLQLSYRKRIAIVNYCNVATSLLADSSEFAAFDIAFSQHIYPLLNGFGEGFGSRLEKIKNILPSDMERSRKNLENLITFGKNNLHSYRVIS